ncbi:hypothetical protein BHE74_00026128 [Ensete ventricosum]|nr:hypothetical protein BHE74_00026128 [Ensete ventricosum]
MRVSSGPAGDDITRTIYTGHSVAAGSSRLDPEIATQRTDGNIDASGTETVSYPRDDWLEEVGPGVGRWKKAKFVLRSDIITIVDSKMIFNM